MRLEKRFDVSGVGVSAIAEAFNVTTGREIQFGMRIQY
jgi:hypothetical protein